MPENEWKLIRRCAGINYIKDFKERVAAANALRDEMFMITENVMLHFNRGIYTPYYHVSGFTHPMLPAVDGGRIKLIGWGLIPGWARTPEKAREIQNRTLNCVGEEAFEKASYKYVIGKDRSALLVDGFFRYP